MVSDPVIRAVPPPAAPLALVGPMFELFQSMRDQRLSIVLASGLVYVDTMAWEETVEAVEVLKTDLELASGYAAVVANALGIVAVTRRRRELMLASYA